MKIKYFENYDKGYKITFAPESLQNVEKIRIACEQMFAENLGRISPLGNGHYLPESLVEAIKTESKKVTFKENFILHSGLSEQDYQSFILWVEFVEEIMEAPEPGGILPDQNPSDSEESEEKQVKVHVQNAPKRFYQQKDDPTLKDLLAARGEEILEQKIVDRLAAGNSRLDDLAIVLPFNHPKLDDDQNNNVEEKVRVPNDIHQENQEIDEGEWSDTAGDYYNLDHDDTVIQALPPQPTSSKASQPLSGVNQATRQLSKSTINGLSKNLNEVTHLHYYSKDEEDNEAKETTPSSSSFPRKDSPLTDHEIDDELIEDVGDYGVNEVYEGGDESDDSGSLPHEAPKEKSIQRPRSRVLGTGGSYEEPLQREAAKPKFQIENLYTASHSAYAQNALDDLTDGRTTTKSRIRVQSRPEIGGLHEMVPTCLHEEISEIEGEEVRKNMAEVQSGARSATKLTFFNKDVAAVGAHSGACRPAYTEGQEDAHKELEGIAENAWEEEFSSTKMVVSVVKKQIELMPDGKKILNDNGLTGKTSLLHGKIEAPTNKSKSTARFKLANDVHEGREEAKRRLRALNRELPVHERVASPSPPRISLTASKKPGDFFNNVPRLKAPAPPEVPEFPDKYHSAHKAAWVTERMRIVPAVPAPGGIAKKK